MGTDRCTQNGESRLLRQSSGKAPSRLRRVARHLWKHLRHPVRAAAMLVLFGVFSVIATKLAPSISSGEAFVMIVVVWVLSDIDDIKSKLAFLDEEEPSAGTDG